MSIIYAEKAREGRKMRRVAIGVSLILALAIFITINASATTSHSGTQPPISIACTGGDVVDKRPGEEFIVKVTFRNTGTSTTTWSVNVAFEDGWTWSGTSQTLTLRACEQKTLTWKGNVPQDAPVDSTARLIVYYNDSFTPQNWWIHIVSGAELSIISSTVK